MDSAVVVAEALSVAALLPEAAVLVALDNDEDPETAFDELAEVLSVDEAPVEDVLLEDSIAELSTALLSAAEAVLATADGTEANSVLCFGTVFFDSRTKNGV